MSEFLTTIRNFTFLSLIILSHHAICQEKPYYELILNINDSAGNPINDAYVFNEKGRYVIGISNNGRVRQKVEKQASILTISHVSYQIERIDLKNYIPTLDSIIRIDIRLKSKIVELPEVAIEYSRAITLAYKNKTDFVSDYNFVGNEILLLLKEGRSNRLKLIDQNSKTLLTVNIPPKAKKIYKDCFNNLHLIYKDSIYQLLPLIDTIILLEPHSIYEFEKSLELCQTRSKESIVIAYEGKYNQEIEYFIKTTDEAHYEPFRICRNYIFQKKAQWFEAIYAGDTKGAAGSSTQAELDDVRMLDRAYTYFKYVESDPIYSPIFKLKENYYLFDHSVDSIIEYNLYGESLESFYINYHTKKGWERTILLDEDKGEFYTVFKSANNFMFVCPIDIENGEIGLPIKLRNRLPENLKIRGGKLFYLYQDISSTNINQHLYVQDLR